MKEQKQLTGVRKWFGDDWINIQDEIIAAQEAYFAPYGNCIISGCDVSGQDIAAGICYIGGKIVRFAGTTGVVSFPVYLELDESISKTREYQTGGAKEVERDYKAVLRTVEPASNYLTIQSTGGVNFRSAFQDANNRMVTDSLISSWNAKLDASSYTAADVLSKLLGVDGAGSALDADRLDGQHGSYYLPAGNYTAADVLSKLLGVDGAGSGLDADRLDGQHGSYYLPAGSYTAADVLAKLLTVDGVGSGLDAEKIANKSIGYLNIINLVGNYGSGSDPNNPTNSVVVTNHSNGPGGYYYIQTFGYNDLYDGGNCAQLALPYAASSHQTVFVRFRYSNTWYSWTEMATLSASSNLFTGFTQLGSGAPNIKMKKLTGATAPTEGGSVYISHGLTNSKILSVSVIVNNLYFANEMAVGAEYGYRLTSSSVQIFNHSTNSQNILSRSIKVLIVYEE